MYNRNPNTSISLLQFRNRQNEMHVTKRGLIRWHEHFHWMNPLLSSSNTKVTIIVSNNTTKYYTLPQYLTRHDENSIFVVGCELSKFSTDLFLPVAE